MSKVKATGGDDLESDDEYLNQDWHDNEEVEVVVDEYTEVVSKKRSGSDSDSLKNEADMQTKKKRKKNPKNLLIDAGKGIAESGPEVQSTFLWAAYTHVLKLKGADENVGAKFSADNFVQPKNYDSTRMEKSMATFLKSGVLASFKRLKKWKVEKSPMVIIICISALRAVEILKEISSLNIRAAKLFAKHMNLADQISMLKNNSYPIAVGTPNRLLKLIQCGAGDGEKRGALSLESTELIVIDCYEDKKKFTVCTMNDTAPDLMKFIHEAVVPEMDKRNTIKFAMY